MQIDWSAYQRELSEVSCFLGWGQITAIASRAVELYLARASEQVTADRRVAMSTADLPEVRAAVDRLSALAQEAEALRASADELQRQRDSRGEALEVAEQEINTLRAKVTELESERNSLAAEMRQHRAEVKACRASEAHLKGVIDGLIAEATIKEEITAMRAKSMWGARAHAAESCLAAIRERAAQTIAECRGEGAREILRERLGWVLEGDASNPSIQSNGSGDAPLDPSEGRCAYPIGQSTQLCCLPRGHGGVHLARHEVTRYPCSPTCTHDDAAKPGHPERVKERSKAFKEAVGYNLPLIREAEQYDAGAEAMRAACWEAVQTPLRILGGVEPGSAIWSAIKTAIESAKP